MRSASPSTGTAGGAGIAEASPAGERSGRDAVIGSVQDGETPTVNQSREWPFRDTAPRQDPAEARHDPIWGADPPDAVRWHMDMTPDQEPATSRSPTTNGDVARQESVDADGVQQVEQPSAEQVSVEQVQVDQDDHAAGAGREAEAAGPGDQDLEQEEVAAQAHDRSEGLVVQQPTSEGDNGGLDLPDPHGQDAGSAAADGATAADSNRGDPPGAGSSSGGDVSPRAAAATAAEESATGPAGSLHRAESGVGWFSTEPGTRRHSEMLSEELSAERPSDEPARSSGPEGSLSGGTPNVGIGLTPVRGEHRGPELIENGMVHVDPDPEIGSPLARPDGPNTRPASPNRRSPVVRQLRVHPRLILQNLPRCATVPAPQLPSPT